MGKFIRRLIGISLLVGVVAIVPPAAVHAKNLDAGLDDIAKDVFSFAKTNVKGKGIATIRVRAFEAPGNFQTAGQTVQRELQERLETLIKKGDSSLKINQKNAGHDIGGELLVETSGEKVMIRIIAKIKTSGGAELQNFSHLVEGPTSDIARLVTPTVDVSAASAAKDSDAIAAQVKQSIESPTVAVQDAPKGAGEKSVVRATDSSRFAMQIRIADSPEGEMVPAEVSNEGGLAFVNAKRGQRFAVTIINDADFDVGVRLTLDGVDSFHFSENEGFRRLKTWIIYRKSSQTIPGWYVRDPGPGDAAATSKDFVFTDLPDSIAARFASKSNEIGIINAQFFPCWKGSEMPPAEEFLGAAARGTRGVLGVGDGKERHVNVDVEPRFFGKSLLASLSVRYEQPQPPADLPGQELPPGTSAAPPVGK